MQQLFSELSTLLYIIAGGLAVIGLTRIVMKWNSGDSRVDGEIISWVGGMLFFTLIGWVVQAAFGI